MKRLNLAQTCLLDASGELGEKSRAQLQSHLEKYPAALVESQLIRRQYELLRSHPTLEMSESRKHFLAGQIKQGIHKKLRQKEATENASKRWKIIYHALAGASALAACLVIYASISYFFNQVELEHKQTIAKAAQSMRDYIDVNSSNLTDFAFSNVEDQLRSAENGQEALANSDVPGAAMQKLADDLDTIDFDSDFESDPNQF